MQQKYDLKYEEVDNELIKSKIKLDSINQLRRHKEEQLARYRAVMKAYADEQEEQLRIAREAEEEALLLAAKKKKKKKFIKTKKSTKTKKQK